MTIKYLNYTAYDWLGESFLWPVFIYTERSLKAMIFGKTILMEMPTEVTDTYYIYRDGQVVSKFHKDYYRIINDNSTVSKKGECVNGKR